MIIDHILWKIIDTQMFEINVMFQGENKKKIQLKKGQQKWNNEHFIIIYFVNNTYLVCYTELMKISGDCFILKNITDFLWYRTKQTALLVIYLEIFLIKVQNFRSQIGFHWSKVTNLPLVKFNGKACPIDEHVERYSSLLFEMYNNSSKPRHIPNNGKWTPLSFNRFAILYI